MVPEVRDGFEWLRLPQGRALAHRDAAAVARHFFTTREWGIGSASADGRAVHWTAIAAAAGVTPDRLLRLRQIHGADIVVHRRGAPPPDVPPPADVIVSDDPGVALAVQAADCVPLLLADRRSGAAAAAHGGWRGLAAGVTRAAVDALGAAFGSRPADLVAIVGPSIGACCYQVGDDVRSRFEEAFGAERAGRWFHRAPHRLDGNVPFRALGEQDGKWFFDAWSAAHDELVSAGVGGIHVMSLCTASHPETFCSYRRDGARAGRIVGVIRPRNAAEQTPRQP